MQSIIIYTCIAKINKKILCEYTEYSGNVTQMAKKIFDLLLKQERDSDLYKVCFEYANVYIYILYDKDIIYLIITNQNKFYTDIEENKYYTYLHELRTILNNKYTPEAISQLKAYSLVDLLDTLKTKMHDINNNKQIGNTQPDLSQYKTLTAMNHKIYEKDQDYCILNSEEIHISDSSEWDKDELRQSVLSSSFQSFSDLKEQNENLNISNENENNKLNKSGDNTNSRQSETTLSERLIIRQTQVKQNYCKLIVTIISILLAIGAIILLVLKFALKLF